MTTPYGPDQRYPQMPPPGRQPQGYGPPAVGGPPPQYGGYPHPGQFPPVPVWQQPKGGGAPCDPARGDLLVAGLGPVRAADPVQRLLARLIDIGLVLGVVAVVVAGALGVGELYTDLSGRRAGWEFAIVGVLLQAVVYLGPPAYEIVMIAQWGATFGKRWMGLRVVRMANGQAPGFGVALVRFLIPAVGALACAIGALVVYASPLFDKSVAKQGWHDMAAKTMVIKVR